MIKELNHVGIRTADMENSIDFYVNILGGTIVRDAKTLDGKGRFVYIQIVNSVIELITVDDPTAAGLAHIAFIIDDNASLDDCYEKVSGMGYGFTVPPKPAASGDGRLAFFNDKSNCSFELIERKIQPRHLLDNPHILEFDHISINLFDTCADTCKSFYLETMGFKIRKIIQKDDCILSYYSHGIDTLETVHKLGGDEPDKTMLHLAFRVADSYKIKEYLESMGVNCPNPVASSLRGDFNVLVIDGPDNVAIEFLDRPALEKYN